MDVKRRLARAVSVVAVAILLGHFVQSVSENKAADATSAAPANDPKIIVPVAAGPQASVTPALAAPVPAVVSPIEQSAASKPAAPVAKSTPSPVIASMAGVGVLPTPKPTITLAATTPTAADPKPVLAEPAPAAIAATTPSTTVPKPVPAEPVPAIVATKAPEPSIVPKAMEVLLQPEGTCQNELDLAAVADAIIEITLLAPCHPNERLVLRHGPLAVTVKTTAQGSAYLKIPALEADGKVSLRFVDGTVIGSAVQVPDVNNLRRFAVQWMDRDTFGVNAFENGSGYGDVGHISAANPGKLPLTGTAGGGYLMILGDAEATPAMLAEVYTYPDGINPPVELSIEAQVTSNTCGREILGEVISTNAGQPDVSDLMLAMPGCAALGDILVLKNPVQDLTLAAAN
jgi:hypothetical protein